MRAIGVSELYAKWQVARESGARCTIIDVREVTEYTQGHVPGAALVVLSTIPSRSDAFPKEGDVYVICRSGGRSSQAIGFLEQHCKHDNLINVTGGTMAWIKADYPIEQGA